MTFIRANCCARMTSTLSRASVTPGLVDIVASIKVKLILFSYILTLGHFLSCFLTRLCVFWEKGTSSWSQSHPVCYMNFYVEFLMDFLNFWLTEFFFSWPSIQVIIPIFPFTATPVSYIQIVSHVSNISCQFFLSLALLLFLFRDLPLGWWLGVKPESLHSFVYSAVILEIVWLGIEVYVQIHPPTLKALFVPLSPRSHYYWEVFLGMDGSSHSLGLDWHLGSQVSLESWIFFSFDFLTSIFFLDPCQQPDFQLLIHSQFSNSISFSNLWDFSLTLWPVILVLIRTSDSHYLFTEPFLDTTFLLLGRYKLEF